MNNNYLAISKAIKENKWLAIEYKNLKDEITNYWIYINDINPSTKKADCYIFNDAKSLDSLKGTIDLTRIKSAIDLEMTGGDYKKNQELIAKIESSPDKFDFLQFTKFNRNVLKYYEECFELDNDPFIDSKLLIEGIDHEVLKKHGFIKLEEEQEKEILKFVKKENRKNTQNSLESLVFALLSYEIRGKTYLVAYKKITFNPSNKCLILDDNIKSITKAKRSN